MTQVRSDDSTVALRPVRIECVGTLNRHLAAFFEATVAEIAIANPILVVLKRTVEKDCSGLDDMCAVLEKRRAIGGYAAFLIASKRDTRMLIKNGVSVMYHVTAYPDEPRRTIVLAQGSQRSAPFDSVPSAPPAPASLAGVP